MKRFKQHINTDIDRILDEEYQSIRSGMDFLRLDEKLSFVPKWTQSTLVHVINGNILINDKIFKLLQSGETARGTVWHTTSVRGLKAILGMEKTKKTLSVRPRFDHIYGGGGVWEQGLVLKMTGDVLFGGDHDIMSIPDENGRRWLRPMNIAHALHEYEVSYDIQDLHKKFIKKYSDRVRKMTKGADGLNADYLNAIADIMDRKAGGRHGTSQLWGEVERSTHVLSDLDHLDDPVLITLVRKLFKEMVSKYITLSKKMVGRFIKDIRNVVASTYRRADESAEFLANNIVVEEIMISDVKDQFNTSYLYNQTKNIVGKRFKVLLSGYNHRNAKSLDVMAGYAYEISGNPDQLENMWKRDALLIPNKTFDKGKEIKFD